MPRSEDTQARRAYDGYDGYYKYDGSKVRAAVMGAGVPAKTAAEIAAEVTRTARRPLTVAKVGDPTETTLQSVGSRVCRRYSAVATSAARRAQNLVAATRKAHVCGFPLGYVLAVAAFEEGTATRSTVWQLAPLQIFGMFGKCLTSLQKDGFPLT